MAEHAPLDDDEQLLWRPLAQIITMLPRALEEQFAHDAGVGMTDYSVLVVLSEADGRQMRLSELATAIALSLSRISRVVDDMARRGLVEKRRCPEDGRGAHAALTPRGRDALAAAYPDHLARVRALVFDHLDPAETRVVGPVLARLAEAIRQQANAGPAARRP